jgi:DNA-binding SARP family transcriptional activator
VEALVPAASRPELAGVIAGARRGLAADNLQEPLYGAVMAAHARLGERAEALRLYDTLRATLLQAVGVPPLPETEAWRQAILAGTIAPPPPALAIAPAAGPRPPRANRAQPLGRQAERPPG